MKKHYLIILIAFLFFTKAKAQNYNNIVNYSLNGTPVNGVKIKTNLPFTTGTQMPTIIIQGYNFGTGQAIGLQIVYYIYGSPAAFVNTSISSFGSYTPQVILANEGGYVVIFINDKQYYQRFTVSAYAQGMSDDGATYYAGWTAVDQALTGTSQLVLSYQNSLSGTINMPGGGTWSTTGNVGIGTTSTYTYMLAVNGAAIATSMTVKAFGSWPDYVFKKNYQLPSLTAVKTYVDQNHHLPDMPSEQEVAKDGINLGDMNKLLTKKVEELTLYLIEKDKQLNEQQKINQSFQQQHNDLTQQLKALKPAVKTN